MITRADIILLEQRLAYLSPRTRIKLTILNGIHNSPHDNPVQVQVGSNSFYVDATDLEDLLDLLDTDLRIGPHTFLEEYWAPFLRQHQSKL